MSIEFGDEAVTLVEIDQPFCQETYGVAPCTAALGTTGTKKCYNSRFTCQDPTNYNPADKTLKFGFSQEGIKQYGYVIPSLKSVSTTPLRVNIGGMDPDMSPFGERETVSLQFDDHLHSDLEVDQYRLERPDAHGQVGIAGFEPYDTGTFWGKWLARNPFHEGYAVRVKEGKMGDPEGSLRVRNYIIDKINGPSGGKVTITCKDLFSLIEDRKAQAPVANTGELNAAITAGAASLVLAPTGIGDDEYSLAGHVAIGSEIMQFTRTTGSDTLTLVTRGTHNTTAAAHDAEDQVQEVLVYSSQRVDLIVSDLLTRFTEVKAANIPTADWAAEAIANLPTLYTGVIPKPTAVKDLIAELSEQVGFTFWPDVETNAIKLKAVGVNIVPVLTADDFGWVLADSMDPERDPDLRVSRSQVYYGQVNPLESLDDEKNYRSYVEARDIAAEDPTEYGTKSIRTVFSRWIPSLGRSTAQTTSDLILKLFRDPPFRVSFDLDIQRAGQLKIAEPFSLQTRALVDDLGSPAINTLLPMSIQRDETKISITAQKLNLTEPIAQARIINIDDDTNNINMRTLHDSLYSPVSSGETVTFIIGAGAIVGADNLSAWAMSTGSWPTGVILKLEIEAGAFLCGPGGNGGASPFGGPPANGQAGGIGLQVLYALDVTNNGIIGGGPGGGAAAYNRDPDGVRLHASGGGAAGTRALVNFDQPEGALAGDVADNGFFDAGTDGALETGGLGGSTASNLAGTDADAGDGGDLGQAGQNSTANGGTDPQTALGGAAGPAVDGDSLVTWTTLGDVRGARIN